VIAFDFFFVFFITAEEIDSFSVIPCPVKLFAIYDNVYGMVIRIWWVCVLKIPDIDWIESTISKSLFDLGIRPRHSYNHYQLLIAFDESIRGITSNELLSDSCAGFTHKLDDFGRASISYQIVMSCSSLQT
jgi:hypothetical protein